MRSSGTGGDIAKQASDALDSIRALLDNFYTITRGPTQPDQIRAIKEKLKQARNTLKDIKNTPLLPPEVVQQITPLENRIEPAIEQCRRSIEAAKVKRKHDKSGKSLSTSPEADSAALDKLENLKLNPLMEEIRNFDPFLQTPDKIREFHHKLAAAKAKLVKIKNRDHLSDDVIDLIEKFEKSINDKYKKIDKILADMGPVLPSTAPVVPPVVAPVEDDEYFFAATKDQHKKRLEELNQVSGDNFGIANHRAWLDLRAAQQFAHSASSPEIVTELSTSLDEQLRAMKRYKAVLDDLMRRWEGNHTHKDGTTRRDLEMQVSPKNSKDEVAKRLRAVTTCIATLEQAKIALAAVPEKSARPSVYYSNLTVDKTFEGANAAADATAFAKEFVKNHNADAKDKISLSSGDIHSTTSGYTTRVIGNEVITKQGQPATAVAMVQETNAEQTYSKLNIYTGPGDLQKIEKAEFSQQLILMQHIIETLQASNTKTGPIKFSGLKPKTQLAAAHLCAYMGYDFQPSTLLDKVTPAEKSAAKNTMDHLRATNSNFQETYVAGRARHEAKIAAEEAPTRRLKN